MTWLASLPLSPARKTKRLRSAGDAARDRRDWPAAIGFYRAVVARDPADRAILIQLAHALKEAGDSAGAETCYLQALATGPDDDDLHLQVGHFEKVRGNLAAAEHHYKAALRLNVDNVIAQREVAALAARAGRNGAPPRRANPRLIRPTWLCDTAGRETDSPLISRQVARIRASLSGPR